jgi:hypothetical protein
MRALGLNANSAGTIRRVKRQALGLGCDASHFRGKRAWSDAQLRRAVIESLSWNEVLISLGLAVGSSDGRTRIKAHALRLGLDVTHLEGLTVKSEVPRFTPDLKHLREAATSIAAAWFSMSGYSSALPIEPTLHDLLVTMAGRVMRVQVKTTTRYSKDGWTVAVGRRPYSIGNKERLIPYDPELIDFFFIMDGDLNMYLIPSGVIAGRVQILLRTYKKFVVGNASGLITPKAA